MAMVSSIGLILDYLTDNTWTACVDVGLIKSHNVNLSLGNVI